MRPLPKPPTGEWMVKYGKGGIPFIQDGQGTVKKWCMAIFQEADGGGKEASGKPMKLSLHKVDDSDSDADPPLRKARVGEPTSSTPPPSTTTPTTSATPKFAVQSVTPPGTGAAKHCFYGAWLVVG